MITILLQMKKVSSPQKYTFRSSHTNGKDSTLVLYYLLSYFRSSELPELES